MNRYIHFFILAILGLLTITTGIIFCIQIVHHAEYFVTTAKIKSYIVKDNFKLGPNMERCETERWAGIATIEYVTISNLSCISDVVIYCDDAKDIADHLSYPKYITGESGYDKCNFRIPKEILLARGVLFGICLVLTTTGTVIIIIKHKRGGDLGENVAATNFELLNEI